MTNKNDDKKTDGTKPSANFRQKAEEKLKANQSKKKGTLSDIETYKLIHELEVHQIELEMQQEELKLANELAEAASVQYTQLYDFAPSGYLTLSSIGEILSLNFAAAKLLGNDRGNLIDKHFSTFLSYHSKHIQGSFLDALFQSQVTQTAEVEIALKDKPPVYLLLTGIADDSNSFCNITLTDITERKIAEENFKTSEIRYRRLFQASKDGILILNFDTGFIEDVNPYLCEMLLYPREAVLGKELWEIGLYKDMAANKEEFLKLKKTKYVKYDDLPLLTKEGQPIWVEFVSNVYEESSRLVIQCNIRNITDRKKAADEIEYSTIQLRQLTAHLQTILEEERKRIAREIHDELGQQLTAIKMDLAWIDKKIPEDIKVAEGIIPIKSKLKNLLSLVDGSNESIRKILNELRHGILEDNGLLEALEWQGNQFTEVSGISVKFITSEVSLVLSEEIANCLFRLYQESLTNIARHAQATKVITSVKINKENIILIVEDDGKGFDVNALQNKKSFGILGMKERVLSLNGKIELVSAKGKGTKIEISLPLKEPINFK